jgi:hypothetical protein
MTIAIVMLSRGPLYRRYRAGLQGLVYAIP